MAESTPLRTVLVSAVRHAAGYVEELTAHPDFELVGVAEGSDVDHVAWSTAEDLAGSRRVPLWQIEDIPLDDVDVALICSEPTRHASLAERMLGAGLGVLVDKPLATDLATAHRVVEVTRATGQRCAVITRSLAPAVRRVREWVDAGRLGLPRSVDIEFLASGTQFESSVERPELVVDRRLSGGGEVMNFLGYPIDYVRAITGCEPIEVFAEAGTVFSALHRSAGVEDVAVVSVEFTHGVMASIVVGRVPAAPGPGPGAVTIRLIGSHGSVELDADAPVVRLHSAAGAETIPIDRSPVAVVLDDLSASIRAGRRPAYDCADAVIAVATIEAVYRSMASGTPERVTTVPTTATEDVANVSISSSEGASP